MLRHDAASGGVLSRPRTDEQLEAMIETIANLIHGHR